jgi:cytochrome c peroxidase
MAHGLLHWSANFNEIQDFEHDLRGPFGGRGLMEDAAFEAGRDTPFGEDKAGASAALDALAAYVSSLTRYPRSPFRAADGRLSAAAVRGRTLFESPALGCTTCHSGAVLTDSGLEPDGTPRVHDVGTLRASSGDRLGAALVGLDTPTLHGLFDGAPYLHDGSAATLREVLTVRNPEDRHGVTSQLDDNALDDLVAYLLSLDGRRE